VEQVIISECCVYYFCPIEFMDVVIVGEGHVCFRCELIEKFRPNSWDDDTESAIWELGVCGGGVLKGLEIPCLV
jgi:hypothetical protein